jgi:hypothetical protein
VPIYEVVSRGNLAKISEIPYDWSALGVARLASEAVFSRPKGVCKTIISCDTQMSEDDILDCIFNSLDCDVFFKLIGYLERLPHEVSYSKDL